MCGWCYLKCHKSIINTEWEALRRETFTPAPLKLLWWLTQFLSSNCIPRIMHGDGCISRGKERWRLRGKCVSVCLSAFCLLSFLLLKIILLKAEYVVVGGQEFYNLKNIWQITKLFFNDLHQKPFASWSQQFAAQTDTGTSLLSEAKAALEDVSIFRIKRE